MIVFEMIGFRRTIPPMNVTCTLGEIEVCGMARDISPKGFSFEIPTPRVKICLLEVLNKDVTLDIENVIIEGKISGYTIDGDRYCIGITINRWHHASWKKIIANRTSPMINSDMNHVAVGP